MSTVLTKTVSNFDLISGKNICLEGIGSIRQLKLSDIRDMGFENYDYCLALIAIEAKQLAEFFQIPEEAMSNETTAFELYSLNEQTMQPLINALTPFFVESLSFSKKRKAIVVMPRDGDLSKIGMINKDNFYSVQSSILTISGMEVKQNETTKVKKSAKLLAIEEKLAKGRAKMEAAKRKQEGPRNELWNIIGAVAAYSNNYSLNNIWELTVAQLYDQFIRINNIYYLDIMATRWCAWGEDKFDHDPWYDVPRKN